MQSRDTKDEFPTLIAFNQDSIFIITEILHGKVKCEPENTTNNTKSFWADVHLRDLGDYKYEYILYQNEEYRLHPVKNLNCFKELIKNSQENTLTKESVVQHATNLRRWCLSHDII